MPRKRRPAWLRRRSRFCGFPKGRAARVVHWRGAVRKTAMPNGIGSSNLPLSAMDVKDSLMVLKRDKRFAPLIKKHGAPDLKRPSTGLRASGKNPFHALVRSIIHQQVSGAAAETIHARFLALFPQGKFPTPDAVRAIPLEKIRAAGLSGQKAEE